MRPDSHTTRRWRCQAALVFAGALLLAGCVPGLPVPQARAPLPVPGSFAGVLPCGDCAGVRTAVRLREDGVYLVRQTFLGRAGTDDELVELGRWRLREDGRVLLLETPEGVRTFAVVDDNRLAPLDGLGQPLAGGAASQLVRGVGDDAFEQPFRWRGMVRFRDGVGEFHECRSDLVLPIAKQGASAQLERAYLATRAGADAELMFTLQGTLLAAATAGAEGVPERLLVTGVERAWPSEYCAAARPSAPIAGLEDTVWWLDALAGASLPEARAQRPRMRLLPLEARIEVFSGCNIIFGSYAAQSRVLRFDGLAKTRKRCPELDALESRLLEVLRSTDAYTIDAGELVLHVEGSALARWRAGEP